MKSSLLVVAAFVLAASMTGCSDDGGAAEAEATPTASVSQGNPHAGSRDDWARAFEKNEDAVQEQLGAIDPALAETEPENLYAVCAALKSGYNGNRLVASVQDTFLVEGEPIAESDAEDVIYVVLAGVCPQ